jgi:hypothetical protein
MTEGQTGIPKADGAVFTARGEQVPVGTEGDASDPGEVAFGVKRTVRCPKVPDPQGVVSSCRRDGRRGPGPGSREGWAIYAVGFRARKDPGPSGRGL